MSLFGFHNNPIRLSGAGDSIHSPHFQMKTPSLWWGTPPGCLGHHAAILCRKATARKPTSWWVCWRTCSLASYAAAESAFPWLEPHCRRTHSYPRVGPLCLGLVSICWLTENCTNFTEEGPSKTVGGEIPRGMLVPLDVCKGVGGDQGGGARGQGHRGVTRALRSMPRAFRATLDYSSDKTWQHSSYVWKTKKLT